MANISDHLRELLASHNLDIDQLIEDFDIKDYQIDGKNSKEIMEELMRVAESKISEVKGAELTMVILRETIKGYKLPDEEMAAEFHNSNGWRS